MLNKTKNNETTPLYCVEDFKNETSKNIDTKKTEMDFKTSFNLFSHVNASNLNEKGQTPYAQINLENALNIIKTGKIAKVIKNFKSGKSITKDNYNLGYFVEKLRKLDKHSEIKNFKKFKGKDEEGNVITEDINEYTKIKSDIPCICWNIYCETGRRLANEDTTLTGYLYFDFDNMIKGDLENTKKDIIEKFPFVNYVWVSCGGKGLGGLVKIEGITKEYFIDAFKYVEFLLGDIDKACKDFVRLNVLSYDPNILTNSNVQPIKIEEIIEYSKKVEEVENIKRPKKEKEYNSEGFEIIQNISNNSLESHKFSYYSCLKTFKGGYIQGQRYPFIVKYSGMMNRFGVSFDEMATLITKDISNFELTHAKKVYTDYFKEFNTKQLPQEGNVKSLLKQEEVVYNIFLENGKLKDKPLFEENTNYYLQRGQYISHLNLKGYQIYGKMLVAPTGSGKTYFISRLEGKKIIIVPTTSLTIQFSNELKDFGAKPFYEHSKEVSNNDDIIVSTYASFKNLSKYVDIKKYNIFVDEAHNFTTSANPTFILRTMNVVLDILKTLDKNKITLLTATPAKNIDPFIQSFEKVVIKKTYKENKVYKFEKCIDSQKRVKELFLNAKQNKQFIAVLYNNTKNGLNSFTSVLKNENVEFECFSASVKEKGYFQELLESGVFKKGLSGIFSTSVLKEGNNFKIGDLELVIVVIGNFHTLEIEQFSARFRDAKNTKVLVLKKYDFQNVEITHTNNRNINSYVRTAECHIPCCKLDSDLGNYSSPKQIEGFKTASGQSSYVKLSFKHKFVITPKTKFDFLWYKTKGLKNVKKINSIRIRNKAFKNKSIFSVDNLQISNKIFNQETQKVNINEEYFHKLFSIYGWEKEETTEFTETLNIIEKTKIQKSKEEIKNEEILKEQEILNSLNTESELIANRNLIYFKNNKLEAFEYKIRSRVAFIFRFEKDVEKIKEIYIDKSATTQQWERFYKQVYIQNILNDKNLKINENTRTDRKIAEEVLNTFEIGEILTNENIVERLKDTLNKQLNKIKKGNDFVKCVLTDKQLTSKFIDYFEIKTIIKYIKTNVGTEEEPKYKNLKEYKYQILSKNPLQNLNFNFNKKITKIDKKKAVSEIKLENIIFENIDTMGTF